MKRLSSDSNLSAAPNLKRMNSEGSEWSNYEDDSSSSFLLKSQNRALSLEVARYKRHISESRKELEMMRGKSREMEALVSVIQRAWSQVSLKKIKNILFPSKTTPNTFNIVSFFSSSLLKFQ